jgi:hypothetical protein
MMFPEFAQNRRGESLVSECNAVARDSGGHCQVADGYGLRFGQQLLGGGNVCHDCTSIPTAAAIEAPL